jgi:AbrB family looped-hinge helix DNA binding protein
VLVCHNGGMDTRSGKRERVRVGRQGRIVIPSKIREEVGIEPGDELVARVEEGCLVLEKRQSVMRRMRGRFAGVSGERRLVDELIAERREEARREEAANDRSED